MDMLECYSYRPTGRFFNNRLKLVLAKDLWHTQSLSWWLRKNRPIKQPPQWRDTYTKKNVFPNVETGCIDSSNVRLLSLDDDSAGKPRDGTLLCDRVVPALVARDRIHDNKVDGTLGRPTDLKHVRVGIRVVLYDDGLSAAQCVWYGVLLGVLN